MEDTIAAIATAPGEGGIGIVRISGEASRVILEKIFSRVKKEYHKQQSVSREDEKKIFFPAGRDERNHWASHRATQDALRIYL